MRDTCVFRRSQRRPREYTGLLKFSAKDGSPIKQWGGHGTGPVQFRKCPNCLALRIPRDGYFVGDRGNNSAFRFRIRNGKSWGGADSISAARGGSSSARMTSLRDRNHPQYNRSRWLWAQPGGKTRIRSGSAKDGYHRDGRPFRTSAPGSGSTHPRAEGLTADAASNQCIRGRFRPPRYVKSTLQEVNCEEHAENS